MRFVRYQGEASIADLARRVVAFEESADAKLVEQVSRALLEANPQLEQIERLKSDAMLVVPELRGVKLTEASQPYRGIGGELAEKMLGGLADFQAIVERNGRREVDDARNTLDLIASREVLELAESEPAVKERLPELREAASERISRMESSRQHQRLAFKLLNESAARLLGAAGPAKLLSFTVEATALAAGGRSTATVCLDAPAPQDGAIVKLFSDQVEWLKIPAQVTVPAGEISATFALSAADLAAAVDAPVAIRAEYGGGNQTASVRIVSAGTSQTVRLASLSLSQSSVPGGTRVTGTLTLSGPAPAGGAVVKLSLAGDAGQAVALPTTSATFAAGESRQEFAIETSDVKVNRRAVIKAEFAGEERTVELEVRSPGDANQLASLTIERNAIVGGESVQARIALSSAVGQATQIELQASVTPLLGALNVSVPQFVVVEAKQSTATFTIQTRPVLLNVTLVVQASYGGGSREARLAINRR